MQWVKWKNSSATSSLDIKRELKPPAVPVKMQQEPEGCFLPCSWLCTMPVPLEVMSSDVACIRFVSLKHEQASAWMNPEPKPRMLMMLTMAADCSSPAVLQLQH